MSNIFKFAPKAQVAACQNLEDFVRLCRIQLTVFGANLDWYSSSWPGVGNFTKKDAPSRGYKTEQLLDAAIVPFAKAYVRYQQGHNPTKLKNEFKAIRCIESALLTIHGVADITLTDLSVMDEAGRVAATYQATDYQAGISLVKLVEFLNESKIISSPLVWVSPFKKPKEINRTDAASKLKREQKLPAVSRLEAMGEMFANDLLDSRDRFTTSIFALCMCAPSRISEVQDLPLNCIHREIDSEGVERVGLRFYAGKGYDSDIKWVSSSFVQIAEEAVRRLTEMSAPGRALASWLEANPDKFYRHEDCPEVGEDQPLSYEQACLALGLTPGERPRNVILKVLERHEPSKAYCAENDFVTLRVLNDYVRSKLPVGWPWLNKERHIKYSQALCCFRQNELRMDFPPRPVIVWAPGKSTFQTDINYIDGQERSIWERYGYKDPDGSPISMKSHQIRHYLNTKAQQGDLGQLYIAKWSGRKNIHQNSTYNHMTDAEHVERARNLGFGVALEKSRQNLPVMLKDLEAEDERIAHVTIFGYCLHDYSMLPCQRHLDCLNCTEHTCVKGEADKYVRLKDYRDSMRLQISKSQSAHQDGVYGADRWTEHQIRTLEKADQLVEILGSDEVPDGTIIRLTNDQEFSPLKRAIAARSKAPSLPAPQPKVPDLDNLRALLGA